MLHVDMSSTGPSEYPALARLRTVFAEERTYQAKVFRLFTQALGRPCTLMTTNQGLALEMLLQSRENLMDIAEVCVHESIKDTTGEGIIISRKGGLNVHVVASRGNDQSYVFQLSPAGYNFPEPRDKSGKGGSRQ